MSHSDASGYWKFDYFSENPITAIEAYRTHLLKKVTKKPVKEINSEQEQVQQSDEIPTAIKAIPKHELGPVKLGEDILFLCTRLVAYEELRTPGSKLDKNPVWNGLFVAPILMREDWKPRSYIMWYIF